MNRQTQKELLNIVKNNYARIAKNFSQTREKEIWPEVKNLTQAVAEKSKVLDVGCGNGRLFKEFLGKKINYLGVDSGKELIKIAKEKHGESKAKFRVGDILELNKIKEGNFDYVFAIAVLHHAPGEKLQIKALRGMRNKIKKDGRIILSVWNLWAQDKFLKLIWRNFFLKLLGKNKMDFGDILFDWKDSKGEAASQRYYHAFRKRELKKIAKKARLKIEKIYKDKYNYYMILKKS